MARNPEGWKLGKRKPYHVRFTHQGRRYDISTKTSDAREAAFRAARIYSDAIEGRLAPTGQKLAHPGTELSELTMLWIEAIAPSLGKKTDKTYAVYAGHWIKHFRTLGGISDRTLESYKQNRLKSVLKETLTKELSAFGRFLGWLKLEGHIATQPKFPELGRTVVGTPHKQGRKVPGEPPSSEQAEAILADLKGKAKLFYIALYETALRPQGTLMRLLPEDLTPFGLRIRRECEKSRKGAVVPISERARKALEAGLPFTEDHSDAFYAACKRVFGEACPWTPYDLKHSRITQWLDAGHPIGGISYNTRVSVETLTKRYAHATRRAGEFVLRCNSGAIMKDASCEGGDLNPYGSYPASTSSKQAPQKPSEISNPGGAPKVAEKTFSGAAPELPAVVRIALFKRARSAA